MQDRYTQVMTGVAAATPVITWVYRSCIHGFLGQGIRSNADQEGRDSSHQLSGLRISRGRGRRVRGALGALSKTAGLGHYKSRLPRTHRQSVIGQGSWDHRIGCDRQTCCRYRPISATCLPIAPNPMIPRTLPDNTLPMGAGEAGFVMSKSRSFR